MREYTVPPISKARKKIMIICEGYEEEAYIHKLASLDVFSKAYEIKTVNAEGNGSLITYYSNYYQTDEFDLVLIFCDTDRFPYQQFETHVRDKVNKFIGSENAASKVIIFGNPCTMQIVISHFGHILLKSASKTKNSKAIEIATGITGYKATEEQRKIMMNLLDRDNYHIMKENISMLSTNYKDKNSTNIGAFLNLLESDDTTWIDDINEILESTIF